MLTTTDYFLALELAILGYVFTCVLMRADYLLEWYYDLLVELEQTGTAGKWLSKPLGLCEACFTGQIALWCWLCLNFEAYRLSVPVTMLRHACFIALAILAVTVIKSVVNKWN